MEHLLVGAARECITPPLGYKLSGYTPPQTVRGVNDDVYVTVFAFETDGIRAMVIAVDTSGMRDAWNELRETVADATGVAAKNIIVACTHTHSGPHMGWEIDKRPNYLQDQFMPAAVKAAVSAVNSMRPAKMGIGTTYSDVAVDRRQITEGGKNTHGQNPSGTWDPTMTVISFREPDGTPIGNLIHYGCHNTANGRSDVVTRDWCGVMVDRLQAESGGITAFINGCGGNCGPRIPNGKTIGNIQMAMELGGKAGIDAVRAWRSIRIWRDAPLKVHCGNVTIPLDDPGTPEQAEAKAHAMGDPEELKTWKGPYYNRYKNLLKRAQYIREGNVPPTEEIIPHSLIALGPLVLLPVPFEPFAGIMLRIQDHSPFPYTLCVGYANGSYGYFPSMDQIIRGGYEVEGFKTKIVPMVDDAEQYYVADSLKLIRQLYEK